MNEDFIDNKTKAINTSIMTDSLINSFSDSMPGTPFRGSETDSVITNENLKGSRFKTLFGS